mmetsp:Transcript_48765/g.106188  ORF Transcript_48765/g.106188 Transcript_48765/m.106188 type:complete len:634 (+) Transcript_48765:84-1985(+)
MEGLCLPPGGSAAAGVGLSTPNSTANSLLPPRPRSRQKGAAAGTSRLYISEPAPSPPSGHPHGLRRGLVRRGRVGGGVRGGLGGSRDRRGEAPAHPGEEALGVVVLGPLPGPGLLQQQAGLTVLRLQREDAPRVPEALVEVGEAQGGLGAAEEGLQVGALGPQHRLAGFPGLPVLAQPQLARCLVQPGQPPQLLRPPPVLLLEALRAAEELRDPLVALQGQLRAPLLEERAADLLARGPVRQLLPLLHAPGVPALLEVLELQRQHNLLGLGRLADAEPRLRAERRPGARDHGALALLHVRHRELEDVGHLAAAHGELQRPRREARERRGAVRHGLDPQPRPARVLAGVVALALPHPLPRHRPVLQRRDVLRLEDLVQCQLDAAPLGGAAVAVAVHVVPRAPEAGGLALLHAAECPVAGPAQGAEVRRAERVVHVGPLLDDAAVRPQRPQREPDLVAGLRHPPAGALRHLRLDDAPIAEEVLPGDPAEELDLEDERRARGDLGWGAGLSIGELGGQGEPGNLPLLHGGDALVPALDDLPLAEAEDEGLAALARGVEAAPVRRERADVVHRDLVALLRAPPLRGLGLPDDLLPHALRQRRGREAAVVVVASVAPVEAVKVVHGGAHVIHGGHLLV